MQRAAVLAVLRELGVSEQRLQEAVVEVYNKIDQLGAVKEAALEATAEEASGEPTEGPAAAADEQAAAAGQHEEQQAAASSLDQPSSSSSSVDGDVGGGGDAAGSHAAATAGLLPPAVTALLQADAAAAAYRPTAVATSVLHGQGLRGVLETMESKVGAAHEDSNVMLGTGGRCAHAAAPLQVPAPLCRPPTRLLQLEAVLAGRQQRSRRSSKRAAVDLLEQQAAEEISMLQSGRSR